MTANGNEAVLGSFYGDDAFPVEWSEGERDLLWIFDDLHIPNPVSPMFFDIGGWWLTCDHMFRRFGTPFASDWIAKNVNGYVYHAAVPADPSLAVESSEYQARYVARVPRGEWAAGSAPTSARCFRTTPRTSSTGGAIACGPRSSATSPTSTPPSSGDPSLVELAVLLEDAIDIHDRHWKIHWMLNFAQFSATMALNGTIAEVKGEVDPALVGRLQSSVEDRNWDAIEELWQMKEEIKDDAELSSAFSERDRRAGACGALEGSERGRRFLAERLDPHRKEFGNKAIWSHEFVYPTWRENPAPIIETIRAYLATDYDYPSTLAAVADDLEAAKARAPGRSPGGRGAASSSSGRSSSRSA